MRVLWAIAFFTGLATSFSDGQQNTPPPTLPPVLDAQPAKVMIYTMRPGVTAPELLPVTQAPIPDEKCKKKIKSAIQISLYVDADGVPLNLAILSPKDPKLDEFALNTVAGDRFKPGTYHGTPVPVAEIMTVTLYACMDEKKDSSGHQTDQVRLWSLTDQKAIPIQNQQMEADDSADIGTVYNVGQGVSAPLLVYSREPEFTDEARKARLQGTVFLSMIVDTQGIPRNLHVVRPLGLGLDQKAIDAVTKFRYKPAMKNGAPVSVNITIEVNFRLYNH
jgi:TonB family protein